MRPDLGGFWGTPTSTIDWCEANYAVTPFVCELFNTVSSLAMVAAGVVGVLLHRHVLDRRMLAAFGLLCVVGLGSIGFHATLRFELQMLDELPMLYLVVLMVHLLLEPGPAPRFGAWLPVTLVSYALLATASAAFTKGPLQFYAFHLSFGSLELFSLWRVSRLARDPENAAVRPLFLLGFGAYVSGIAVWTVDLKFCHLVSQVLPRLGIPNPQLHAWWHVLVSCGFYLLILVVGYDRLRRAGVRPVVERRWGIPALARRSLERRP